MCCPAGGMVHIKYPLLLIEKSSLCSGSSDRTKTGMCYPLCVMGHITDNL